MNTSISKIEQEIIEEFDKLGHCCKQEAINRVYIN